MDHEGLLCFFEEVYGMLGEFYGESEFDQAHQEPSPQYEGTTQNQLQGSKVALIRRQMASEGLAHDEVLLVDDDPQDISSVQSICQSLFVSEHKGLTGQQLEELRKMAGIAAGPEEAAEQAEVPIPATPAASPAAVVSEEEKVQKPAPQVATLFAKQDRLVTLEEDEEAEESTSEEEDEEQPSQMTIEVASAATPSNVPSPPPKNPLPPPPTKSPPQEQTSFGHPLPAASTSLGSSQRSPGQSPLPPSKKSPPPPPSGSKPGHPKASASQQPKPPPKQSATPPPPPPKQPANIQISSPAPSPIRPLVSPRDENRQEQLFYEY